MIVTAASDARREPDGAHARGGRLPRDPRLPRRRRRRLDRAPAAPVETTPSIDVATLAERLRDGEVELLDVREDDEWQEGHVPGSLHVPYHELAGERPLHASANVSLVRR